MYIVGQKFEGDWLSCKIHLLLLQSNRKYDSTAEQPITKQQTYLHLYRLKM